MSSHQSALSELSFRSAALMVQDKCWEFLKPKYEQYQQWCLTWQRPLIKVLVPRGIQWCNCFKPSGQELIIHSWLPEREKKKKKCTELSCRKKKCPHHPRNGQKTRERKDKSCLTNHELELTRNLTRDGADFTNGAGEEMSSGTDTALHWE